MESTANIGNQCGERWKGIGSRYARSEKAQGGGPERCIWLKRNRTADLGAQEDFPDAERLVKRLVARELILSCCARCRAASVADGDAEKYQLTRNRVRLAEPTGVFSGRGPH